MTKRATYEPDQAAFISFIGIFFPPIAVAIVKGWHRDVAINFGLWILGALPGMIHAFWIVAKHTRPSNLTDPEALYIESPPPSVYEPHYPYNHQERAFISPASTQVGPLRPQSRAQPSSNESSVGTTTTAPLVPRGILSPFGDHASLASDAVHSVPDQDKKI